MILKKLLLIVKYNFLTWKRNPRIILTFFLAFILSFLLTDKVVGIAKEFDTIMQIAEPFVWTFGDSNSILLSSMLLLLIFADMPFINSGTPLLLMRINRKIWLWGQTIYIVLTTLVYMVFMMVSCCLVSMSKSFVGDMWSETAAILGYSNVGAETKVPSFVRVMESGSPYECMAHIFCLMMLYTLLLMFIMLIFNLMKGQIAGVVSVFTFSLIGFLLSPMTIQTILQLEDFQMYIANVITGWISPLNHSVYYMHSFGYDYLPTLWQTYLIFILLITLCIFIALKLIKNYNFIFTGTEN